MVSLPRKHEHVYIDTSAYTARRYPAELVRYMQTESGSRKVLFGTNYPMVVQQQALKGVDELGLDDEARELFLGGNARRLLELAPNVTEASASRGAARR